MMYNFDESDAWKPCFVVSDVDLPTGYYFGFTAATGDLCGKCNKLQGQYFHFPHCKYSDNHDILSVRVYDVDSQMDDMKKETADQPTADVVSKEGQEMKSDV